MGTLLACPFCRTLYAPGEREICPQCDLRLVDMSRLPPSIEAQMEAGLEEVEAPIDQELSFWFWRRGRGLTFGLSALGLCLFFAPWARLERPDVVLLSGFDLARGGATWLFGGAVGWFLLLPLLLTRRTIRALIGARVIVITAALMTVGEVLLLRLLPPTDNHFIRWGVSYQWGLDASLAVGLLTVLLGWSLGGSDKDFRDLPLPQGSRERNPGEPLH